MIIQYNQQGSATIIVRSNCPKNHAFKFIDLYINLLTNNSKALHHTHNYDKVYVIIIHQHYQQVPMFDCYRSCCTQTGDSDFFSLGGQWGRGPSKGKICAIISNQGNRNLAAIMYFAVSISIL